MVDLSNNMIRELQKVAELYNERELQRAQRDEAAAHRESVEARSVPQTPPPARHQG